MRFAAIAGWGVATGSRLVSNAALARTVPGCDEGWIERRTGIRFRYHAEPGESTSTLATQAGRAALARAGIAAGDLDLVIVATCTPDTLVPPTAPRVQAALGADRAGAFDVNAACAGFLMGLSTADSLIRGGAVSRALVVGAEVLSRFMDWSDPKTCVLFGDAAGAVVLESSGVESGLLSLQIGADGAGAPLLEAPAGGSARPATLETVAAGEHAIRMNGLEVYRAAVRVMASASLDALRAAGMTGADADLVIMHQANQRIIAEVGERMMVAPERVFTNVARYGNTSAASVPIAIAEAADAGLLRPGARVVLTAVGAGFTWAAGVLRWTAETGAGDLRPTAATAAGDRSVRIDEPLEVLT